MTQLANNQLIEALHKVQGQISGVKRDSTNPHFKNRYASLEAVVDALRPVLQANDLIVTQAPGRFTELGCIEITTTISHISGQSMSSVFEIPLSKKDSQGAGSAITYGCRYSLMALFLLPPQDDDAEGSIDRSETRPAKSSYALKKENPNRWSEIENMIRNAKGRKEMLEMKSNLREEAKTWPQAWKDAFNDMWAKEWDEMND